MLFRQTHVSVDSDRPGSHSARRTPTTAGSSKVDVDAGFIQRWVTNASELLEQVTESLSRAEGEKVRLQEEAETYHQQAISVSPGVIQPAMSVKTGATV